MKALEVHIQIIVTNIKWNRGVILFDHIDYIWDEIDMMK
jgi:hypothetical protein